MRTALVTGANGFVGRHVCRCLVDDGWQVRATTRDQDAESDLMPQIERCVTGDLATFSDWPTALKNVDVVIHLAARTHCLDEQSADVLAKYRTANVDGTRRLLEACRGTGVRRFVFLSSIKAVGEGASEPYFETDECHPVDSYGQTKREAELLTLQMATDLNIEPVVIRPPLVYGPGVRGNLARLMSLIHRGCPLPLGCVQNARSMIHVDNLAEAIRDCLEHAAAAGEVFHVADDPPVSGRDLALNLAQAMGCRVRLVPIPIPAMRLLGRVSGRIETVRRLTDSLLLSTVKIRHRVGWNPRITMEDGLKAMARDYLSTADVKRVA